MPQRGWCSAIGQVSDEAEPLFYLARLVTFGLIIVAIIQKNRPGR
jgi:hypothetical protein